MHARPGDRLDNAESTLAVVEREEHGRHLSKVLRESAIPNQMADNAKQLGQHHADDLGASRHLDTGHHLDRCEIRQVVHHAAEIVDPVGVRDVAVPGLALAHLLGSAMVEADLWNRVDDLFAIELKSDAQDTMRARVLWPHVEENEIRAVAFAAHAPLLWTEPKRLLLGHFLFRKQLIRPHLRRARRMLFA